MFPELPKTPADLVPLPRCDGPKLKPFEFDGPQKIEFLEYVGEGSHAHVFKVRIQNKIYALKLFRFNEDDMWRCPQFPLTENFSPSPELTSETMAPFADYGDPFNCECRAFGRLQETGHEDVATKCFGYLLLDQEHERIMLDQFKDLELMFNGNIDNGWNDPYWRERYGGKPPIRGIVKEFGQRDEDLTTRRATKLLNDIKTIQQLGIFSIDVAHRQIISGKFSDFSTAITVPHFMTNPELNPHLNSEQKSDMEFETFQFSSSDYWYFDQMVREWNAENKDKRKVTAFAFPSRFGCHTKYQLRSRRATNFYTFVDPRKLGEGVSKKRKWARWNFKCDEEWQVQKLCKAPVHGMRNCNDWELKDGYIFPKPWLY